MPSFPIPKSLSRTVQRGLLMLGFMLLAAAPCSAAKPEAHAAADAAPLRLGIHNGLINANAFTVDRHAQAASDWIGGVLHRKVIYQVNYGTGQITQALLRPGAFDLAIVRPADLTAKLLQQGWTLIAMAHQSGQGVDFIAQPCPDQPAKVLLGGSSLAMLGTGQSASRVCVPAAAAWTAPQARFLTAAKGSLIDQVTRKVVQDHGGQSQAVVNTSTLDVAAGFLQTMHVAAIGAVSPFVSKAWVKQGGVLIFHQPMPPLALLAAPGTSADTVTTLRAAVLDAQGSAALSRALQIPKWDAPDPQVYAAFIQWLHAPASAHPAP